MTKQETPTSIAETCPRIKALQAAMRKIEKDFGRGSVMFLGQQPTEPIEVIPTGSMALNAALGIGGYPRGRIIEIYGGEASGKTTLALHAIAEAQRIGGTALFVDAEHAFDPRYAAQLAKMHSTSPTPSSAPRPLTSWWWTLWQPSPRKLS